jgi:hypothetical protein
MKLKEAFLWQPDWFHQGVILIAGAMLVTAISYLHTATGLAYEFHALSIVQVLAVSWFIGTHSGYALSILANLEWFLADRTLAGEQAALLAVVFNTTVPLTTFIGSACGGRIMPRRVAWIPVSPQGCLDAVVQPVQILRDARSCPDWQHTGPLGR